MDIKDLKTSGIKDGNCRLCTHYFTCELFALIDKTYKDRSNNNKIQFLSWPENIGVVCMLWTKDREYYEDSYRTTIDKKDDEPI